MEAGGSRAALKRARQKQREARPPPPERHDPQPTATSSNKVVGKKRDKRKDKRAAKRAKLQEVEAAGDEPDELEGVVVDGELLLRDPNGGAVYASERDERGCLVAVGRWEAGKVVPLAAASPSEAAATEQPEASRAPSVPHPLPQPLAFAAAEDDHCETAPEAYAHVAGALQQLAAALGVPAAELRIYDPFYCNGAVERHLAALGFPRVHNRNEDFYALLAEGRVPPHDVVVTNPPYSGSHPLRLLRFLAQNGKPWLALMPNWVGGRDFYAAAVAAELPFYLAPRKRYHYWTPKGRRTDVVAGGAKAKTHGHTNAALGARTSPFVSFWYGGRFPPKVRARLAPPDGCVLCSRLDALPAGVRGMT